MHTGERALIASMEGFVVLTWNNTKTSLLYVAYHLAFGRWGKRCTSFGSYCIGIIKKYVCTVVQHQKQKKIPSGCTSHSKPWSKALRMRKVQQLVDTEKYSSFGSSRVPRSYSFFYPCGHAEIVIVSHTRMVNNRRRHNSTDVLAYSIDGRNRSTDGRDTTLARRVHDK